MLVLADRLMAWIVRRVRLLTWLFLIGGLTLIVIFEPSQTLMIAFAAVAVALMILFAVAASRAPRAEP